MSPSRDIRAGARNLLINCAELSGAESLLIVREDPDLGWYDGQTAAAVADAARTVGITPTTLDVGAPQNSRGFGLTQAMADHECTVFMSRIGDQDRFADPGLGKKTIMCYARDANQLASAYGQTHHKAMLQLKKAINDILLGAKNVRVTCPLGTDISGDTTDTVKETAADVSVRRFPMGVPQPLDASRMSGQVVLARYLTPTGSKSYEPPSVPIHQTVMADVSNGRITGLTGDADDVERIRNQYRRVAGLFNLDPDIVHSFHAGIHPGSAYADAADDDPDRWSNSIFTNPRTLHFHTCGNYPPGEICWMVIDHTLRVDGKSLWRGGRLCVDDFGPTARCLADWPELRPLFDSPSMAIGLPEGS